MMIIEVPGRARTAARLTGNGLVSRFLQPLLFSHRKIIGRAQPAAARGQEKAQEAGVVAFGTAAPPKGSNAPLESLAGGALASRFHAWRGASGRRYVCSVFPADAEAIDAGLPDFADAIAMAVACGEDGNRRRISLLLSEATLHPASRQAFVTEGLAKGAVEWHIHLLAEDGCQRRAAARDIEAYCRDDARALR